MIHSLFGDDAHVLRDTDFQLLLLANLVAPLGTALISPLLDSLQQPYGATDATIGLMMTAFTAPAVVMIPLIGVLADRFGRKPFLVGGLFLFSLAGTALAVTTDFSVVLALRFCQGIGFAAVTPVIITSVGDLYSGSAEATGQGLRFSISGLTQAVFPFIGGALVVVAWQYPLLLYLIGVPITIVLARCFTEPSETDSDPSLERDLEETQEDRGIYTRELATLILRPRVFAVLIVRMLPIFMYMTFMTYISLLVIRSMNGSPRAAGALVALASITYAVAATQAGRFGSSFVGRTIPLGGAQMLMAVGLVTVALAPTLVVGIGGVIALGFGFGLSLSLLRSVVTAFAPTRLRGGLVSFFESAGRLSATIAPIAVGIGFELLGGSYGQTESLQFIVAGIGVGGGILSISCLVIARLSASIPVRVEPARAD